jgi:hypothetical protein
MADQVETHETQAESGNGQTMTALVTGIIADTQALIRQEMQLAKVEMKQELGKTRDAALSFAIGAGFLVLGFVLLSLAVIILLPWITNGAIPLWGSFAIFGGVLFLIGAILLYIAYSRATTIHLVPQQTAQTLQENVQWIKNHT